MLTKARVPYEDSVLAFAITLLSRGCCYNRRPDLKMVELGTWRFSDSGRTHRFVVLLLIPNATYTRACRLIKENG